MSIDATLQKLMTPFRKPVTQDEGALRTRIARGFAAQELRENTTFLSLIQEVEEFYLTAWRASKVHDTDIREKCHVAVKIVDDIQNMLISRVRDGDGARETLEKYSRRPK